MPQHLRRSPCPSFRFPTLLASVALLLTAAAAQASKPQFWNFSIEKDYADGKFSDAVVDSYGQLSLGRNMARIATDHAAEIVAAFAQTPDGSIYAALSSEPRIYKLDPDGKKAAVIYKAPSGFSDITAMIADAKGNLLVALSGQTARLVRVDPTAAAGANGQVPSSIRFEDKDVDYIWSILQGPDGAVYLGTGPHGKVYKLNGAGGAQPEPAVVLDSGQKNITSLAFDKTGNLVAGTDVHGLVIRVDQNTNKPFVLLDAGAVDVNSIVNDPQGNLYVATAKAESDANAQEPEGAGGMQDQSDTKSKPDVPETQPVAPPAEDTDKPQAMLPAAGEPRVILCAAEPTLPDIKALLKRAAAEKSPGGPAPKNAPKLGSHAKIAPKPPRLDQSDESAGASTVYRISSDGVVTTLVQDDGMNYSLLLAGDQLLIGTGDEGKLFSYRLSDQSLALIARVAEQQVSTLFADHNGTVFVGTANMAQVYEMGAGLAAKGTFTSQVLDAAHTADWGHAAVNRTLSGGAKVTIATRSGNTQDVDASGKFWSDWSDESDDASAKITSPSARFLQYRVTLSGGDGGTADSASPVVSSLRIGYQTQNIAPHIKSVSVDQDSADDSGAGVGGGGGGDSGTGDDAQPARSDDAASPSKIVHITWDAADPNNDTLVYRIYYKQADAKDVWTPLARNVKDILYDWNARGVPDGKYQVKVVASDSPDNPAGEALETARTSAPFIINHISPTLSEFTSELDGNKVKISGTAKDALSAIIDVRYQVDGQGDWQPAAASDKIFDSPQEAFTIVTRPLSAEPHRITVRATDAAGNNTYRAVTITVKS